MIEIHLNEPELLSLELFRVALSEPTEEARLHAIEVMRHEVSGLSLESFPIFKKGDGQQQNSPDFAHWVAETSADRREAAHQYADIVQRYQKKNERKLNVAEYIGKHVWQTIQEQGYQGVQVPGGILEEVRNVARELGVTGAKDEDTVRKIWKSYRGVVHLGMAMDFCEDHPRSGLHVLHVAERIRQGLSKNCPKGTSKPYIEPSEQISFLYISEC